MHRACPLLAIGVVCAAALGQAMDLPLGPRALTEAVELGQSRIASTLAQFHAPYRIPIAMAPIDDIEVVTPFRRVVLAAETRARAGDRRFGQRDARAILGDAAAQIDLLVALTFHPLNTYIGVPDYGVRLLDREGHAVEPRVLDRVPRFGPRVAGVPLSFPYPAAPPLGTGEPLTGGVLIAGFDGSLLDSGGRYEVAVSDGGTELARTAVDFGGLR